MKRLFYQEKKFKLKEVDFIDGTIILNKDLLNNMFFDENIFIYFETMDLCKRLSDKKIKMYAIDEITFDHFGGQSHDEKYDHEAHLSRNWHYNWSKFYYYKKNFSYFFAIRKIFPNFLRYLKNMLICFIIRNRNEFISMC